MNSRRQIYVEFDDWGFSGAIPPEAQEEFLQILGEFGCDVEELKSYLEQTDQSEVYEFTLDND